MKAYKQDLAYIHDVGFGSFAKRAAPALLDILQRGGSPMGWSSIWDVGADCGRDTLWMPDTQFLALTSLVTWWQWRASKCQKEHSEPYRSWLTICRSALRSPRWVNASTTFSTSETIRPLFVGFFVAPIGPSSSGEFCFQLWRNETQ